MGKSPDALKPILASSNRLEAGPDIETGIYTSWLWVYRMLESYCETAIVARLLLSRYHRLHPQVTCKGVIDALCSKGHKILVRPGFGVATGVTAAGIDAEHRTLFGGSDARRERYAFGW